MRSEQRYEALERARRERRRDVRRALREGARSPGLPARKTWLVLLAGGAALVLLLAVNRTDAPHGPPLARSCTTPAIALSSKTTGDGTGIAYSITGPRTGTYVVAVDAVAVTVTGDGVSALPQGAFGAAIRRGLSECVYHGTLPDLAAGPHTVVLFRDGRNVARARLSG